MWDELYMRSLCLVRGLSITKREKSRQKMFSSKSFVKLAQAAAKMLDLESQEEMLRVADEEDAKGKRRRSRWNRFDEYKEGSDDDEENDGMPKVINSDDEGDPLEEHPEELKRRSISLVLTGKRGSASTAAGGDRRSTAMFRNSSPRMDTLPQTSSETQGTVIVLGRSQRKKSEAAALKSTADAFGSPNEQSPFTHGFTNTSFSQQCESTSSQMHDDVNSSFLCFANAVAVLTPELGGDFSFSHRPSDSGTDFGFRRNSGNGKVEPPYRATNFVPPLLRRKNIIVLPTFREMMNDQMDLNNSKADLSNPVAPSSTTISTKDQTGSGSAFSVAAAFGAQLPPGVEVPKGVVAPVLLKMSNDRFLGRTIMRVFYCLLGDTILSADPSAPSCSGPVGISISQFRNLGRVLTNSAEKGVISSVRGPLMNTIFETAAKPFQFLSVGPFCTAVTMLSLVSEPITPSESEMARHDFVDSIIRRVRNYCRHHLVPFLKEELPGWCDPEVDLYWLDPLVQKGVLEHCEMLHEVFALFSVAPEEEIMAAMRRSSSLTSGSARPSTARPLGSVFGTSGGTPKPPPAATSRQGSVTHLNRKNSDASVEGAKATDGSNKQRGGVTFVSDGKRPSLKPAPPRNSLSGSSPMAPSRSPPPEHIPTPTETVLDGTPSNPDDVITRLQKMGFPFVTRDHPDYYVNGCEYVRILTTSSLARILSTMNVPNITPSDIIRAAKAASTLFPNHPYRMLREVLQNDKKQQSSTTGVGSVSSLFSNGANPLSRFVPPGDIFLLEPEFVEVLMRLSLVAFPELVTSTALTHIRGQADGFQRSGSIAGGELMPVKAFVASKQRQANTYATEIVTDAPVFVRAPNCFSGDVASDDDDDERPEVLNRKEEFCEAFQRLLTTYFESFFVQVTGGSVTRRKQVVVSQTDVVKALQTGEGGSYSKSSHKQSPGPSQDFSRDTPRHEEDFNLALPQVNELVITEPSESLLFFKSDRERDRIPGWDQQRAPMVTENGAPAVAQGFLMNEHTGVYVLFEGRVAIRATRVLAAPMLEDKATPATIDDVMKRSTMAEFRIPAFQQLFAGKSRIGRVKPHRAVRCYKDGSLSLRVSPHTLIPIAMQFSCDGVHWTPRSDALKDLTYSAAQTPIRGVGNSTFNSVVYVRQNRSSAVVPKGLLVAIQTVFSVYARYQEIVKEDTITLGKWRHLCCCLFYVVQDNGDNLRCVAQAPASLTRRMSIAARGGANDKPMGPCLCAHCSSNRIAEAKQCMEPIQVEVSEPGNVFAAFAESTRHNQAAFAESTRHNQAAFAESTRHNQAAGRGNSQNLESPEQAHKTALFDPSNNIPFITLNHIAEVFAKHSEERAVHKAMSVGRSNHNRSYRVLTLEGCTGALIDILINHNNTCTCLPLASKMTETLMKVENWWNTLHGLIAVESARRMSESPSTSYESIQLESFDSLEGNLQSQLVFRQLWAVATSALGMTVEATDADAHRALLDMTEEYKNLTSAIFVLPIFHHGVCVAEVVNDPNHRSWETDSRVIRNRFLTVTILAPSYVTQFGRLLSAELPFAATIERLFKGGFLPLPVAKEYVSDSWAEEATGRRATSISVAKVSSASRRFWLLRKKMSTEVIGCLSNIPGQCGTLGWLPVPGSFSSTHSSLFLIERDEVLTSDALSLFRFFNAQRSNAAQPLPEQRGAEARDRQNEIGRDEQNLRQSLEEMGYVLNPVFP